MFSQVNRSIITSCFPEKTQFFKTSFFFKTDHTFFSIFRSGLLKTSILSEQSKVFLESYLLVMLLHDDTLRLLDQDGVIFSTGGEISSNQDKAWATFIRQFFLFFDQSYFFRDLNLKIIFGEKMCNFKCSFDKIM